MCLKIFYNKIIIIFLFLNSWVHSNSQNIQLFNLNPITNYNTQENLKFSAGMPFLPESALGEITICPGFLLFLYEEEKNNIKEITYYNKLETWIEGSSLNLNNYFDNQIEVKFIDPRGLIIEQTKCSPGFSSIPFKNMKGKIMVVTYFYNSKIVKTEKIEL